MSDQNSVVGYGSLISRDSLYDKCQGDRKRDEIYEREPEGLNDQVVSENLVEEMDELESRIYFVPVKLYGFKRRYSLESSRGGAMLEAVHTGNEEDWMNAVIITGLEDEEMEIIQSSEENYEPEEISLEDIETYLDEDTLEERGIEMPEKVEEFVPDADSDRTGFETERSKNHTYHLRILKGIERMDERYEEDFADEFKWDYLWTTEERSHEGAEYEPVWMVNLQNR